MRRLLIPLGIVAAIALAFGGGGADAGGAFEVSLDEWKITPQETTLRAGKVKLVARNDGKIEHELLVVRTDRPAGSLPLGLDGPALTLPGMKLVVGTPHKHGDLFEPGALKSKHIRAGASRRDAVTLTKGRYVMLCNLPGHYQAGQYATLIVE